MQTAMASTFIWARLYFRPDPALSPAILTEPYSMWDTKRKCGPGKARPTRVGSF